MIVKGNLSTAELNDIKIIKENMYGTNAVHVHNAYVIGKLLLKREFSYEKILCTIRDNNLDSSTNRTINTTFRLNQDAVDILDDYAKKINTSKIAVIRALIFLYSNTSLSQNLLLGNLLNTDTTSVKAIFDFWLSNERDDIEGADKNKSIYNLLGWNEFEYFDIMTSFYGGILLPYSVAMSCNKQRPLYKYDNNTVYYDTASARDKNTHYICNIKKEYIVQPYCDYLEKKSMHIGNRTEDKKQILNGLLNDKGIDEIATLIYSYSNFYPCPRFYNQIKGIISSNDSLEDMLILIENGIEKCETINAANQKIRKYNDNNEMKIPEVTKELLLEWKDFFIKNRDKAFLQDIYFISENGKLIPLNDLPYPTDKTQFEKMCRLKILQLYGRVSRMLMSKS